MLRLLSTLLALGCFPLLWKLAKRFDENAVIPVCLLFTIAPVSIYYATEGRMFAGMVVRPGNDAAQRRAT